MENKPPKIDEDLILFIAESRDILEEIEPKLIGLGDVLEKNGSPDEEIVNLIFRGFHTIKGSAAFYQLDGVVSVAHKSETLLEFFRKGIEKISASSTDILCQACDVIEELFQQLETLGHENLDDDHVKSIIHRLNGRIDIFKQKHTELTLQSESFQSSGLGLSEKSVVGGEDEEIPSSRKLGKHIRIFIRESRDMMRRLDSMDVSEPLENEILGQGREILNTLAEGAAFLGFDRMVSVVNQCMVIINQIQTEDRHLEDEEREIIWNQLELLHRMIDGIETSGTDELSHDQYPEPLNILEFKSSSDHEYVFGLPEDVSDSVIENAEEDSLDHLFFEEVRGCIGQLKDLMTRLGRERLNHTLLEEIKQQFHEIKGSSGIANQGDLEWISSKAEECVDETLDDRIILDEWDIKALWHVVSEMQKALVQAEQGQSGMPFKKIALAHIVDQIKSGKLHEEKERDIPLPDIGNDKKNRPVDEPETVSRKETEDVFSFPLPDSVDSEPAQASENMEKSSEKPGWSVEKRASKRKDIRVNIEKLDELINLVGELVIAENMVVRNPDVQDLGLVNFEKAGVHLRKIVRDLQDVALAVRMVPISGVFRKMIRLVHDLSVKSGKKINLRLVGDDTEIDKTVAEQISDPLVHLVRNAIDHGIEKKNDRGEDEVDGRIVLEARHEGGAVLIIVRDNGKGLDLQNILTKAKRAGILRQNVDTLSDTDIRNLIFHPGFSTQDKVTDLSGRGVGMDVVKENMEKVNGKIHVYSKPNLGTIFVLRIPLTLAIIDGMLVKVGDASYTIPLLSIRETVQVREDQIILTMDGQEMVNIRGDLIPIVRLHKMYNLEPRFKNLGQGLIVIIEHHYDKAGLFIDTIIGEQQAVIKGLSGYMGAIPGVSGCTILGDGEVSLILDVAGIIQKAKDTCGDTYTQASGE